MLFNMGDWQVLVSLMGLFMSLWFVIGSCSDRKMISGHFSIRATYVLTYVVTHFNSTRMKTI